MSKTTKEVTKVRVPKKTLNTEPEVIKVDLSKPPVKKEVKSKGQDPVENVKNAIQESKSIE